MHLTFLPFRVDLSENYALQGREDEAEALSSTASERFKLTAAELNISASSIDMKRTGFHKNATPEEGAVKLLPADIDLWFNVIQSQNFQANVASSQILQRMLQLNLTSREDALRMQPYAAHLKVAAFSRLQKR